MRLAPRAKCRAEIAVVSRDGEPPRNANRVRREANAPMLVGGTFHNVLSRPRVCSCQASFAGNHDVRTATASKRHRVGDMFTPDRTLGRGSGNR